MASKGISNHLGWSVLAVWLIVFIGHASPAAQWLEFETAYESYFAREETLYGERQYHLIHADYHGEAEASWIKAAIDVGGRVGTNLAKYATGYVPEAYVQFRQNSISILPQEITVGRKKEHWSRLDEDWGLGIVQPVFRWDFLQPQQQGLTGGFITWRGSGASFTVFGSYLFIPEQGPVFELKNGRISSASPWFTEPTNSLILFEQPTEIRYHIIDADISEIVSRGTVGALFSLGHREEGGPWSVGGYLSKPRNNLMLPFYAPLVLGPTTQVAEVSVYPRVERHHVGVFDIGYRSGTTSGYLSVLAEFPNNPPVEVDTTRQKFDPQILVSPGIEFRLFPHNTWGPTTQISYLHQDGGETSEAGPFATGRGNIFGYRLSFTRATS
ncbi:MAG: hypothetical protein NDI61_03755, partial [Bdellovibrionaceae bacterium]|nr:hypothetical protein [Pseudobdellovibrionaceae bacterium]